MWGCFAQVRLSRSPDRHLGRHSLLPKCRNLFRLTAPPRPARAPTVDAAEVMAQAQQRAELAKLREEFEAKLAEERAAREAAEARAQANARAEIEAALKAEPRLARLSWLTVSGFVQADLNVNQTSQDQLNTSTGAPLNDNRFLIRRARLGAFVDQKYLAGVLELDANTVNGPQVRPMDVEATVKWPGGSVPLVALTAGTFQDSVRLGGDRA